MTLFAMSSILMISMLLLGVVLLVLESANDSSRNELYSGGVDAIDGVVLLVLFSQ
jgi:hypothetical protein